MLVLADEDIPGFYPGETISLGEIVAPRPLVLGPVAPGACVPTEILTTWNVQAVVTAPGWSSDDVLGAMCDPTALPDLTVRDTAPDVAVRVFTDAS